MIRKLLVLTAVFVVASLQAVTFQWNIPNSEYSWDSAMGGDTGEYGIYFVYSQSDLGNAANVWSAARDYANSGVKVVGLNSGETTINGANAPAYGAGFAELGVVTDGSQNAKTGAYLTMNGMTGTALGTDTYNGYYYLVVFDPTTTSDEVPQYAVSNVVQYAGAVDKENGIYNTNQNGGEPDIGDFVDIGWMGGTWRDAVVPEPTALALLALGVAGLALRRKI